jgi:hypothetical protein
LRPFDAYSAENLYASEDPDARPPACPAGQLSNTKRCLDFDGFIDHLRRVQDVAAPNGAWTSFGVYAPAWAAYGGSASIGDALPPVETWRPLDHQIWEGTAPHGPDCGTSGSGAISQFLPPRSTLAGLPFVTRFNRGIGTGYAVEGVAAASTGWNHFGGIDVLPLWLCRLAGTDAAVTIGYADGDAWDGDSALRLAGTIPAGGIEEWALWTAAAPLTDPVLRVRYRGSGPVPYARLTFSDGTSRVVHALGTEANGWVTSSLAVSDAAGKTLARIGIGVENSGDAAAPIALVLGELALADAGQLAAPALVSLPPSPLLSWATDPSHAKANIWALDAARSCLRYLGPAFTSSYEVGSPLFPTNVPPQTGGYRVQPVSNAGVPAALDLPPCADTPPS